jgi:PKD repeat protein
MSANNGTSLLVTALLLLAVCIVAPAMAATTEVQIVKYANDNTTILDQVTVNYTWMEANLPVLGDGTTHYYHQGPVFVDDANETLEQELRWNPEEDTNVLEKDMGAVMGTNVKDLCDLVGGMSPGEEVKILSSDGFFKWFAYENVYGYSFREGPIGLCWYMDGNYPDSGYSDGMRLVWFADDSVNTLGPGGTGVHAFGNYDWHEAAAEEYWYYYISGSENYPTTTGLSSKYVNRIYIYSDEEPPVVPVAAFTADVTSGTVPLTVQFTDQSTGDGITEWAWDFENDGTVDSTDQSPSHVYGAAGTYTVNLTVTNAAGSDDEVKTDYITVIVSSIPRDAVITTDTIPSTMVEGQSYDVGVTVQNTGTTTWSETEGFNLGGVGDFSGDAAEFAYPRVYLPVGTTVAPGASHTYTFTMTAPAAGTYTPAYRMVWEYHEWFGQTLSHPVTVSAAPMINELFNGTVTLEDGTFTWTDDGGTGHVVDNLTPHGALEAAFLSDGFTYGGGWAGSKATALIDWIDSGTVNYTYDDSVTPKLTWNYQLNGAYQNYFSDTTGVSNNMVADGDYIEFYYGPDQQTTENATAVLRITVNVEAPPGPVDILYDGNVTLNPGTFDFTAYNTGTEYQIDSLTPHGALDAASKIAGFDYNATDKKWASMGTMLLDDVDVYNYDSSVTPKLCWAYAVNGVKKDDFSSTEGISVYRVNDGDLVEFYYGKEADTIENATAIIRTLVTIRDQDVIFDGDVTLLPGTFNFTAYNSGLEYQINSITPHGALDAASNLGGFVYNATDKKWGTMGTMLLDDIGEYHYDGEASPKLCWAYAVNGVVKNDYSTTEGISVYELQNNDRVEYFYGDQGDTLQNASAVVRIRVHVSSTDNWTLLLEGAVTEEVDREYFEEGVACIHSATYTDLSGTWEGIPLWALAGYVDDGNTHGPGAFNDTRAAEGYQVKVIASDGFNVTFSSADIARNDNYLIANTLNGQPLLEQHWPLKLVGSEIIPSQSVAKITTIELIGVEPFVPPASVHIIKYGADGVTIINETNVTVEWMEENLDVIGDGVTTYKFQGITNDPTDLWDPSETLGMSPPKIENAVKGTRVKDLCDLVGGMGTGTDIRFVANDGYETTLGYSNIYTNPAVQERQGDAILAWYADGDYVPAYTDGIRLFFMPDDHVFGQWDMHESMDEQYWHYYYQAYPSGDPYYPGVMYPSCAGLSAKFITTIEIYSEPPADWTLQLDGTALGGLNQTISRVYFEQALACQFGAEHAVEYTDSSSRTWGGMPLWFLCGFVDDADQHSSNAYNDTLALAGYNITITASDGYSYTFDSQDTIRNTNYIVANTLNGTAIPDTDSSWPLRLVGQNVSGAMVVKKIASITLEPVESQPPGENTVYLSPATLPVVNGISASYEIRVSSLPDGLAGYDLRVTLDNPSIAEIIGVQYPAWAVLNNTTPQPPGDSLTLSGVDVGRLVEPGAGSTLLATITVRADTPGTSGISITTVHMDADGGALITPTVTSGEIVVYIPMAADFSANVTSGRASLTRPLVVAFTDLSTGVPPGSLWSWDFDNNGVVDSTLQNPVMSFTAPGNYTVKLTVQNTYSSDTEVKANYIQVTSFVKPFPGQTNEPTDPDGDYLYEDINGNGRLDYDDVVIYYENMQWIRDQADVGIEPYDYNQNGRIDYDDVVVLYWELLESHT